VSRKLVAIQTDLPPNLVALENKVCLITTTSPKSSIIAGGVLNLDDRYNQKANPVAIKASTKK
jgi:hypothetical protein